MVQCAFIQIPTDALFLIMLTFDTCILFFSDHFSMTVLTSRMVMKLYMFSATMLAGVNIKLEVT